MISIIRTVDLARFLVFVGALAVAQASAQEDHARLDRALLASADGSVRVDSVSSVVSPARFDRGVQTCVDMTGINSWDGLDDADNVSIDIDISSSLKVVGAAWDVGIASIGESWLADASVFISNSDGSADGNAVILAPGFEVLSPGDQEFSSGGVVLFADAGLPEVEPNGDGIIRLQFYEDFDDVPDAIDSEWRNAESPVTCPGIWLELDERQGGGPGLPPDIDPNAVPLDHPMTRLLLILLLGLAGAHFLRTRA